MIRSQSQRLADARASLWALGSYAALATVIALGLGVAYVAKPAPAAVVMASADPRGAMAKCGAYDVFVIGHDMASASDARHAALGYVTEGCEYVRGLKG